MTTSLSPGYPIRLSGNHGMCASPPGFSQLTTAFFASQLPGIRHKPLSLDHIIFFAFRITPQCFRIRSSFLGFLPSALRYTPSFLPSLSLSMCACLKPAGFPADKTLLKQGAFMGLIRVELMTPSLSEKCSNQLSYSPVI